MCPFPAEATTESPSPPEEPRAHNPPVNGGSWSGKFRLRRSWFNGKPRAIFVLLVIAIVIGALALLHTKARTKQASNSVQPTAASADGARSLRLRGTTEAVQTRAILAPL